MRIGQTSIVVFSSKFLGAALSFLASLYFARTLGAEAFGVYGLVLTIVTWLKLGGTMGVGSAMTKRISEDDEPGAFLSAGFLSVLVFGFVASAAVVLAGDVVTAYVGAFNQYVAVSVVWVVVGLLFIKLFYTVVIKTLEGERKVHVAALLDPVKFGSRSVLQIGLVFAGFGLGGMLRDSSPGDYELPQESLSIVLYKPFFKTSSTLSYGESNSSSKEFTLTGTVCHCCTPSPVVTDAISNRSAN